MSIFTAVRKFVTVLMALCFAHGLPAQTYDESVEQYIAQYKSIAIEEMQRVKIPASITLAQGIIESGAGRSALAKEANNHFGIKCHSDWKGDTYTYDDDRKNECFRKYKSAAESFKDHSAFLSQRQRYAVLFTYDIMDYKSWSKGLKACGYATNPKYAGILIQCIEDYDLHQWDLDEKEKQKWFASINHNGAEPEKDSASDTANNGILLEREKPLDRVCVFNDIKYVLLREGESLNNLATDFEIGLRRLMRYNDITRESQLRAGDKVYLQPKRHNGDEKFHTVREGETMFSISHDHGIQLKALYEKNLMSFGTQPITGEIIYLRDYREMKPIPVDPKTNDAEPDTAQASLPETFYTVSRGDTLYSISKKYNLSIGELKEMNQLRSDDLQVGKKLKVSK